MAKHTTIAVSRDLKKDLDELQDELNVSLKESGLHIGTKGQLIAYVLKCAKLVPIPTKHLGA